MAAWWQNIPKEYRQKIYINDNPTIEDDLSALHLMLLYAQQGIEYDWDGDDPYYHPISFINDYDEARTVGKLFLLTALNAKDEESGFAAARNAFTDEGIRYKGKFNKDFFEDYLAKVKDRHPPLKDYLCSNTGVALMNLDAQLANRIIQIFVRQEQPILCVHDSFIVEYHNDELLEHTMRYATKFLIKELKVRTKRKGEGFGHYPKEKELDEQFKQIRRREVDKEIRTKGYKLRMNKFYDQKS